MTRETKVGLMMLTLLFGVFGFMLYKQAIRPLEAQADQNSEGTTATSAETSTHEKKLSKSKPVALKEEFEGSTWAASETALQQTPKSESRQSPVAKSRKEQTNKTPSASSGTANETHSIDADFESMDAPSSELVSSKPKSVKATSFKTKPKLPTSIPDSDEFVAPAPKRLPEAIPVKANDASDPFGDFAPETTHEAGNATQRKLSPPEAVTVVVPEIATKPDEFESPAPKSTTRRNEIQQVAGEDDPFGLSPQPVPQAAEVPTQSTSPKPAAAATIDEFSVPPTRTEGTAALEFDSPSISQPSTQSRPISPNPDEERLGGFKPVEVKQRSMNEFTREARSSAPTAIPSADPFPAAKRSGNGEGFSVEASPRRMTGALIPGDTYDIEPNDNYWTISRKKYGTGRYFMALSQHNEKVIPDPKRMKPGVTISTPPAEQLDRDYSTLIPKAGPTESTNGFSSAPQVSGASVRSAVAANEDRATVGFFVSRDGIPMYRVGEGDTLSDIAQKHLGRSSRWVQVMEMNRDVLADGNSLTIGTVLRLPGDASRVEVVGGTRTIR